MLGTGQATPRRDCLLDRGRGETGVDELDGAELIGGAVAKTRPPPPQDAGWLAVPSWSWLGWTLPSLSFLVPCLRCGAECPWTTKRGLRRGGGGLDLT